MDAIINPHVALAILVAIVVSLLLNLLVSRWSSLPALAGPVTFLAYAAGHVALKGWPLLPPKNVMEWPVYLALGGAVVLGFAFVMLKRSPHPWATASANMVAMGILLAVPPFLILRGLADYRHGGLSLAVVVFMVGTSLAAWWWERACAAWSPFVGRLILTAVTVMSVGALLLAGSFEIAQRGMILSAAAGAPLGVAWWRDRGTGAAMAAAHGSAWIWLLAYALSSLDPAHGDPSPRAAFAPAMILLALAPLAALAARPLAATRPRLAATAAVLATLLVAGGAVAWVWVRGQPAAYAADASEY